MQEMRGPIVRWMFAATCLAINIPPMPRLLLHLLRLLNGAFVLAPAVAHAQSHVALQRAWADSVAQRIDVRVWDGDAGLQLEGAEVVLLGTGLRAVTDRIGRHVFQRVPVGGYVMVTRLPGYAPDTARFEMTPGTYADAIVRMRTPAAARRERCARRVPCAEPDTLPPRGAIMGQLFDGLRGPSMAGVRVVVVGTTLQTRTNWNGYFLLRAVPSGTWTLRLEHPGYEPLVVPRVRVAADSVSRHQLLLQPTRGTVAGVVRDSATGEPLAGMQVTLSVPASYAHGRSKTTNARGEFRFDSIPRVLAPRLVLDFRGRYYRVRSDTFPLAAGPVTRHDVRLVNDSIAHLASRARLDEWLRRMRREALQADSIHRANGGEDSILTGLRRPDTNAFGYQQFGHRLLWAMVRMRPDSNVVFSPLGAGMALALVAQGARGATAAELGRVLGAPADSRLAERNATLLARARDRTDVTLEIANALWVDTSVTLAPDFARTARDGFRASARTLSLNDPSVGPPAINAWADSATHSRVGRAVPDRLPPDSRLVITNAVYFLGKWRDEFDSTQTRARDFHVSPRERRRVMMMDRTGHYAHRREHGYQLLRMPYRTGRTAMYVILPDAGVGIDSLERAMQVAGWPATANRDETRDVHVVLPRVQSELAFDLRAPLRALGLRSAFDCREGSAADFSALLVARPGRAAPLCISDARQGTFLRIDESGTEAAAATSMALSPTSVPPPPIEFVVDRPFLFLLRDEVSGAELFAGRIVRP